MADNGEPLAQRLIIPSLDDNGPDDARTGWVACRQDGEQGDIGHRFEPSPSPWPSGLGRAVVAKIHCNADPKLGDWTKGQKWLRHLIVKEPIGRRSLELLIGRAAQSGSPGHAIQDR